jgi:hypothetical protein
MKTPLDNDLNKVYESFNQNHDQLREMLMASLPARSEKRKGIRLINLVQLFIRGDTMKVRITKLAAAAVIIMGVFAGLYLLMGPIDVVSVGWADVLENMEAAQTVTFTFEYERRYEDGEYCWGKGTTRIKGPYRRAEATGGHRYQDGPPHEETTISIMDLSRQNRFVLLYPPQKWAYFAPDHGGNDTLLTYDGLKKDFRDGTEESLGRVKIDGRDAICFKVSKDDKEITVWADPDTALPIRIERLATEGIDKTVLCDIAFDVELDDELFDMTLPDDYIVTNMETEECRVPYELTQEHLIEGLAVNANALGGKFPTLYKGGRRGKEAFEKYIAETRKMSEPPVEDKFKPSLGVEFVKRLPEGSDYQYVGEDVKLGDANTPVCWWKPPGSKTYRVVYGDLSIRDVEPSALPKVPWLTEQK